VCLTYSPSTVKVALYSPSSTDSSEIFAMSSLAEVCSTSASATRSVLSIALRAAG
jgi:hypothetical protein